MFLTRAAQIIGKEGFKTFGYALQQKMHQNMTDAKVYGIYQKKIAPKQRITDNKADCTAICRHSGSYESMLAAVSGMDAEYIAVCDESCEFDKDYTAIVSHYIRIQKRAGRSLSYIYTDSENYNQNTIHSVHLSAGDHSICFSQPGVTINLSGFLKGYALETIRGILNEALIENALINMGNSSVLALGNHPVGTGWKVNNILLHNECLTTSGNDSPERRHIVSPRDGKLVEGARQISVVTTNGAIGEILSTALFAADGEQRKALMGIYAHCRVYISTVLY